MIKIRERYIWAIFIIAVILISLYLRYYYQAPISISVSIAKIPTPIYPFQLASIPISISNTGGSTINNISMGTYVNGNLTNTYKAYIPAGKQVTIYYNFTPGASGPYKLSLIVDPSNLYNIVNRQSAQSSETINVSSAERPAPNSNFPANPSGGQDLFFMNPHGYIATLYFDNFTKYFYLTSSQSVNNFLYPALDVFSQYINQMVLAHAYYTNYSIASLWINGYVTPSAFDIAAAGKEINVTKYQNTSVMYFGNSTTLCTWYSGGWTKILISVSGKNCTEYLANTTNKLNTTTLYYTLRNRNISLLNYSGYSGNLIYAGDISVNSNVIVFESIFKNGSQNDTCYGNFLNGTNDTYCLQALYQSNMTLYQLNTLKGEYNTSVWWIPTLNTTPQSLKYAINLTNSYSFPGNTIKFISAYSTRCALLGGFGCKNPIFAPNATALRIRINVTNNLNKSVTLNKIGCVLVGNYTLSNLNILLPPNKNTTLYMPCYGYKQRLNSSLIPYAIPLDIKLNYSYNGVANTTYGYVEIQK